MDPPPAPINACAARSVADVAISASSAAPDLQPACSGTAKRGF
jgi:hypothetical protein